MKASAENLLQGLDQSQRKAVSLAANGVVAAGAGSGKTRVLASRYVYLVLEKNLKPEEILSLTFTNKAVSEMYSRIYRYLLEQADEKAEKAIQEFHKARISTLDSFSAAVARSAAARYGISPDFSSDDAALRDLAREAALRFVLDHRENPAIRELLSENKIRTLAEEIFVKPILKYSPVSSPLDLKKSLATQKEKILSSWREKSALMEKSSDRLAAELRSLEGMKKSNGLTSALAGILLKNPAPATPDITALFSGQERELRQALKKYFDYFYALISVSSQGNFGETYWPLLECFRTIKGKKADGLYHELESLANYALNFGLCSGVFELMETFQAEFNAKKRESGLLSFNDIAHLALDILREHPDIRKVYKDSLKMIMVDEFQDNNALQRDLIYLLAEKSERNKAGLPGPDELEANKMFFVGDEKQSIYRFRGADVAVFRSLGRDMEGGSSIPAQINLNYNYRSRPNLIAAFNHLFSGVFPPASAETPDYEAVYTPIQPPENKADDGGLDNHPLAHFCFLNGDDLGKVDGSGLKSHDMEAVFIAAKIRDMYQRAECKWGDFAVLLRSYTHQSVLEKYFREFGIPYNTDRPAGLFNDAPILDLRAYLRLLAYPEDRVAYAALIRSPFMRLSDQSLAACLLSESAEPFAAENEALIPKEELALYSRAGERYRSLRRLSQSLSLTELLAKLWFEEGYRHECLWTEEAQLYESLFDLFFSLASDAEARGKGLEEFIEYLDDLMSRQERPDDKDIPGEGEAGVRLMSIHKSKGLEFPVVFIFDCAYTGNKRQFSDQLNFHEKYGLLLKLPQAEELPLGGDYFSEMLAGEEKAKDAAELKRLLYVAMTRAEHRLFLCAALPAQTRLEKEQWDMTGEDFNEETIRRRLVQLDEKDTGHGSFLKLLAGPLAGSPPSLCSLEAIPVLSRAEISSFASQSSKKKKAGKDMRGAALSAAAFYEKAELLSEGKAGPQSLAASKLSHRPSAAGLSAAETSAGDASAAEPEDSPLDTLLAKAGLQPAEFGSLVHELLEAKLKGQPCPTRPKILSRIDDEKLLSRLTDAAGEMADGFTASELGRRWAAASQRPELCHESEFSVITSINNIEGKPTAITGQIDLLFEEENEVLVVDFKTDRLENPENHYGQLAAYHQAAGDIFGKPVSAWLFYLRSGRALNVTEEVAGLSLEELLPGAISNYALS
ncbi:MAG: UvrD-helicase domain-containing protein [Treponema sp.]|nr:UvrD-helicase domain-containing protein [Treponema sp.]